jgi:hypothetical protein
VNGSGVIAPIIPQESAGDWHNPGLFATVLALRHHKGMARGVAMMGEIESLGCLFGILQNASQPYSSRGDGTRGSKREFVSDKDCVCLNPVHCRKGTTK